MIRLWKLGGRAPRIHDEVLEWVDEVWPEEALCLPFHGSTWWIETDVDHPWRPALEQSLDRLELRWSPAELGALAAEAYFDPFGWQEAAAARADRLGAVVMVLGACVVRYPPADIHRRLEARLRGIFADPYRPLTPRFTVRRGDAEFQAQPPPTIDDHLGLLLLLAPAPATLDLIERLVSGDLDTRLSGAPPHGVGRIAESGYAFHLAPLTQRGPALLERLFAHDRLSYDVFARAAHCLPSVLGQLSGRVLRGAHGSPGEDPSPFLRTVADYCERLAWDLARNLSHDSAPVLKQIDGLRGNGYLVQAARHHHERRLGRLVWKDYRFADGLESGIVHLAAAAVEPESEAERSALAADLRGLRPQTLKALLPIAWPARSAIAAALDWQHVLPLIDQIVGLSGLDRGAPPDLTGARTSPDAADGVVDVPAARAALAEAGSGAASEVLALFRSAQVGAGNALRLIEALSGRERAWVEKGLAKRHQLAVKAYGLLPLERGEEEVAERYLWLHQFAREARAFGPQRQASEQAAARVALSNLAQNAGYADATRLEWVMEARLGSAGWRGEARSIEGYEVELVFDGLRADVRAHRGGRVLKSVPRAVRRSAAYEELVDAARALREQGARMRASLERLMSDGEPLMPEDLDRLLRIPLGRAVLTGLVVLAPGGMLGLLEGDGQALVSLHEERVELAGPLGIAHPFDLFESGMLGNWQREIVRRRIVQPFAQVFRELYVLTPAEREAGDVSHRFAGHSIDSAVATRLFQTRSWEVDHGDAALPRKRLSAAGLWAVFAFPGAGHFLAETPIVTSGEIRFEPIRGARGRPVPLASVPPRLFSEVMRDADLVVSVAQRDGVVRLSPEGYQRRGELVQALLTDLGLPNVAVDGHFARVEGRRARYRVHLGSGAIHIEPGNYLCVVPRSWETPADGLFIPFADEGDRQVSVIVSKVLLLARDDLITDPRILAQIERRRGA